MIEIQRYIIFASDTADKGLAVWKANEKSTGEWCRLKDVELLETNNTDRKKLIDEILTAIQDGEVITGDRLNDWDQEAYGIEHRIGAEG